MRIVLGFCCSLFLAAPMAQAGCDAYREYVTTYNYLLDKKTIAFTKDQASRTAMTVAEGCDGGAARFIRVFDLLVNARLTLHDAMTVALEIARTGDDSAENFVEVFKAAFLEKYLDLSLHQALDLARSLSGKGPWIRKDYVKLVDFCLGKTGLALPKPECATLARDIALMGEEEPTRSVAERFVELFEFLRSHKDGPQLATGDALAVTKELIAISPEAGRNFIPGYKFARDKNNLGLDRAQAVGFARQLAALTKPQDSASEAQ
ncbi:hypothetical protein [Oligoflexus tunisiensis]|uniref:hypothetical protein n=1 Tax=Oligoflexus tunisiensis TaxID=708132 RepID=UPI00114CAE97|nr:hypothetical protein [Oligoflexus tunisiensis]